jgi:hypothetical protein
MEDFHHQLSTASWYNATILPDKCNRDNALFLSSCIKRQNSLVLPYRKFDIYFFAVYQPLEKLDAIAPWCIGQDLLPRERCNIMAC